MKNIFTIDVIQVYDDINNIKLIMLHLIRCGISKRELLTSK